jgi:cell division septation protein DedD
VIQVGAFRSLARAEKFQKTLQGKGYDAYLETHALPDHGLIYRVRMRGYMSLVDAREEMERLHEKEGLDSFALPLEPELP